MLDSTKKNAYNIIGSKIFRKKFFFFWNSAKGQFAEVVAYNIIAIENSGRTQVK